MKKILYVINSVRKNGPTNVLINMIYGINKKEYEIYVLTIINENDPEIIEHIKNQGVKFIELNYAKNIKTLLNMSQLNKIVIKEKIDIVHTHGVVPVFLFRKAKCLKVTTVHCCLYEDFKDTYGKIKGLLINELYVYSLKKCNKVICCSESVQKVVSKRIKNTYYVRNGIDFNKKVNNKNIRKEMNISDNSKVYIFIGTLSYTKNVLKMLEEFKNNHMNNEYLLVLGDGPLRKKVNEYESQNIRILGFKSNIEDYLYMSNVYVSFSNSEGLSISVIEALHNNLLILLSSIPSHKEFFEIDNKYYLGEFFDKKGFSEKIKEIRKKEKEQIYTKKFQEKYLSSKIMMNKYEEIYIN